jgi:deoxyribonuclease V
MSLHDLNPLDPWDGTIAHARAMQELLVRRVIVRDGYRSPPRSVVGITVAMEDEGARTRAVAVVVDPESLDLIDAQVAHVSTSTKYVPGFLSFQVMPALLRVLDMLPFPPDLVLMDGDGIAHPQRFGLAAHFGVVSGVPTIGIGNKLLLGTAADLHQVRGAYTPLRDRGEQIGWVLRSKPEVAPIIVSPGHRVAMASAADLVMRYTTTERYPEPVQMAQALGARGTLRL